MNIVNITKSYGEKKVLDSFCCSFEPAKINCITGESGIGKTTLLNLIMGLEKPDSGFIECNEELRIAAVFQEDRLIDNMSGVYNVRAITGKSVDEIEKIFTELGLKGDCFYRSVNEYSGGMRRRVAIARALLAESDIIVMDEPFQGMDMETQKKVQTCIREYATGRMLIVVAHDRGTISFADVIISM